LNSIQQQLRRQWLIALVALMVPLLLLADYGVRHLSAQSVLSRLQHDIESLTSALTLSTANPSDNQRWQLDESRLGTLYQRVYSGHYFHITSNTGSSNTSTSETNTAETDTDLRSRSLWDRTPPKLQLAPGESKDWTSISRDGTDQAAPWLNLGQGVRVGDTDFTIWVAEDIETLRNELNKYRLFALLLVSLTLGSLLLIQSRVTRSAFQRLQPLEQQLRALRFGETDTLNSDHAPYPEEVHTLVSEIERLLNLLQERSARSRNALGNLAHEMKRPLQRLQLLSEQLTTAQQQDLQATLDHLQHLVNRELKRARIVGMAAPGRHANLDDDITPLIDVLKQLYPNIQIHTTWPPAAILPFDRDDLLELIGNLLDNACKYGGSVKSNEVKNDNALVELNIQPQGEHWQISVTDHGPGIPENERLRLLNRGTRLDESAQNEGQEGSGLGLAIVSDIVNSYKGKLILTETESGWLKVLIEI
jgi:signal transduction histidine kinase